MVVSTMALILETNARVRVPFLLRHGLDWCVKSLLDSRLKFLSQRQGEVARADRDGVRES
jgi:hypothetical protein